MRTYTLDSGIRGTCADEDNHIAELEAESEGLKQMSWYTYVMKLEAENRRMDDALHSAFQDYRDDFPDSSITDYDGWLAVHVTCGNVMWAP